MIDSIDDYLKSLDSILSIIPKTEKILLEQLINKSYNLMYSDNLVIDIQFIDYLICYMLNK